MCGIIGYVGKQQDVRLGIDALKRLEYRGYDSAGLAFYDEKTKKIKRVRAVGKVAQLEKKLGAKKQAGTPFILHTRWATHGAPTNANAHPHCDTAEEFFVVHNGIIENFDELRQALTKKGHKFVSQTDTEVLAHLVADAFKGDLLKAVQVALSRVQGTYGLAVISSRTPDQLVVARLGSPLLIGVGEGEYFVASDPAGVVAHTKKVVYLEDGDVALLTPSSMKVVSGAKERLPKIDGIEWTLEEAQKGGYPHFMLKEIMEQPHSLIDTMRGRLLVKDGNVKLGGLEHVREKLKEIDKVHIVACGTAYYAGLVGKYMLEEYGGIAAEAELASEFRYRRPRLGKKTMVLCVSQSGETADTLAALREAKKQGALTLGIVNAVGSTIARQTDGGVYNHAGPEIGVASTKAFTSQITVLAMLAVLLGRQRGMSAKEGKQIVHGLASLPKVVEQVLAEKDTVKKIALRYKNADNMLVLGRKYSYPIALEGALKVKEISYLHAEGYAGGEIKHGPIAMVDKDLPVIVLMPKDSVYQKMASNAQEIKARKGPLIIVTTKGNTEARKLTRDVIIIPDVLELLSPIVSVIPLQLFAYYLGVARKLDVDKPRNLAKSVTVE